tara:strand:+ start:901 stop:1620 length:720 start_codon:yes stop_codon:yes gene_type:complete
MAGHSKWANIKHRKGAQDKKKGKIFTKLIKEITISTRLYGGDLDANPRLRKAVYDAKANNMPLDKIQRAIKKGTGDLDGIEYDEIIYEGFGPYGIAIMLDVITDNKNRSVAEIRHIFSKYSGSLSENGSVAWMFSKKGQIIIKSDNKTEESILNCALENGVEDIEKNNDTFIFWTSPENFTFIRDNVRNEGFVIESAEMEIVSNSSQKLEDSKGEKIINLLNELENHDDVNNIHTNFTM